MWRCAPSPCQHTAAIVIGNHALHYLWRCRFSCPEDDDLFQPGWWRSVPAVTTSLPGMERRHTGRIAFPPDWLWQIVSQSVLCAFKAGINGPFAFFQSDSLLHGYHINSWLKHNLATFAHFLLHFASLSLHLLGPKRSGPSALNDERQNLLLCTSATVILFSYFNETEQAVCACALLVLSLSNG